jgi:phosphohistidine phosphatase SixA
MILANELKKDSVVNVFIMRHGEAESVAKTDMQRELTREGREDVEQMSTSYRDELSQVDIIWASPYLRAQQTAELMSAQLLTRPSTPVTTQPFLPPNGNPRDVLAELESHRDQTVLIISHQPLVGVLVEALAGLEPGRYRMGTGSLACLSTEVYAKGCCELRWLHQPASTQSACL